MIAALRGALYEALKREEETLIMYERLSKEAKDKVIQDFFKALVKDVKNDIDYMKHLNLHSIVKFGLALKFHTAQCTIDEKMVAGVADKPGAKEILKLAIDEINADIEYYEHIADHSVFGEVKRLFRILADKELEHKCKLKALDDLLL